MDSWNLRDELLRSIKQWYLILGFILGGGVIGYIFAYFIPPNYLATADLYVGIDVTRVNEMEYLIPLADEEPLNLDDYKNWQLKQLSDILYLDKVLEVTLDKLKVKNQAYQDITLNDFRKSIDIYWYDTGIWRLEVINRDPAQAEAAVKTWLDSGYAEISGLLINSEEAATLDYDLQVIKGASSLQKSQSARLKAFQDSSQEWSVKFDNLPQDQPLPEEMLVELRSWILTYRTPPDLWHIPVGEFPDTNQSLIGYSVWLEKTQVDAAIVLNESQKQYELLIQERNEILPEYYQALDDSLGLSANIVLEKNTSMPIVSNPRSTGKTTISGAGFGLIVWLLFAVIRIKGQKNGHS